MEDDSIQESKRNRVSWLALKISVVGVTIFSAFGGLMIVWHVFRHPDWLIGIVENHFPATVGAPLAMIAALVIVTLFRYQSGPVEFEAIGFKFKGAAGPVIMWVIVFLALVSSIKVLKFPNSVVR